MDLGQYIKRVLKWWWLFVLSTGLAAVASYYASLQQPRIYQATTTLIVGQITQQANPTSQDFYTIERLAESYAQMATRQPILQAALDNLGVKMSWQELKWRVNAYPVPQTQLLGITVEDTSPERAVAIADEVARELIWQSPTSPQNQKRAERSEFVQSQLDSLEERIGRATLHLQEIEAELDVALSARQIQDLETEKSSLDQLIFDWQANYAELFSFLQGSDSPNYLSIIEPAQTPTKPIKPRIEINVVLAAIMGFMLAFGAALLLEYIDNTIKSTDDLNFLNITALGSVANIKGKETKDKIAFTHTPFSPIAEAYRLIRINIQFMALDKPAKLIMVTSANQGEGKSTTAANLAIIMSKADQRTIIVDADMRRPTMHKIFQLPNSEGLSDLIRLPNLEIEDQLKSTEFENLKVITSGPLPPNPAEMLGSKRMTKLLERLDKLADVIVFDCPPVLVVTDASVLSNKIDGVVLVTRAKQTRRDTIKQATGRLQQVGATILGAVLNGGSGKGDNYYHSYYTQTGRSSIAKGSNPAKRRWWQRFST